MNLEFSPEDFEKHVLGCKQDWRQSLLVEVGLDQGGLQQALPLGPWLHQQGISVDDEGRMISAQPSRFAREAGLEPQPSLSGPPAHSAARSASSVFVPCSKPFTLNCHCLCPIVFSCIICKQRRT